MKGQSLIQEGKLAQAKKFVQRAANVSQEMVDAVIKVLSAALI